MAKKAKRKAVQQAPISSLERQRRETKLRLQREVRLEKQIASLMRQLDRLVPRRHVELRHLAHYILDQYGDDTRIAQEPERDAERLELAQA
jgi:hypothetical protein